ncbi:MAG: type II CAAX endopeptidase family protein [Bacillota bacterium]|nr:type II CAAX endopeptidase family protein [Bacillota bacterium]
MKTYFHRTTCAECGESYDSTMSGCPHCHARNAELGESTRFRNDLHVDWIYNIAFLLVGLIGFQIIGTIVQLFISPYYQSGALSENEANMMVNGIAYGFLFVVLALMVYFSRSWREYLRSYCSLKTWGVAVLGFLGLLAASVIWNLIKQLLVESSGDNANQSTIVDLVKLFPAASVLVFGILGPLCEEITYRSGLFSLLKRVNRPFAYIVSAFIFGSIHFDWSCLANISENYSNFLNELVNLPDYIFAGVILAFVYDRWGIGASSGAHAFNNLYSVIGIMLVY